MPKLSHNLCHRFSQGKRSQSKMFGMCMNDLGNAPGRNECIISIISRFFILVHLYGRVPKA
jgi:hypothetical protein